MKILIVGGGIGGLATARALLTFGHDVEVLEKAPALKPVGAGISLQPNAMQALKILGLHRQVQDASWAAQAAQVMSSQGKILTRFDFSDYRHKYEFLPRTIFRADLIKILAQSLKRSRCDIQLGQQVQGFSQTNDSVVVTLTDGSKKKCDVLVGADGIRSVVRRQLWGSVDPRYAGYTCWRGMVDRNELFQAVEKMTEVWGKGARFGFMRCNASQVYWFATQDRKSRTDHIADASWKSFFQSWPDPVPDLINATPDVEIVHNDIVDRAPIFPWGQGRVTLLGDAAHAMTPNFGQGGAQAIEDAVVLARVIGDQPDVESALRNYERIRKQRTHGFVNDSLQFGKIGQGGTLLRRLFRNYVIASLPQTLVNKKLEQQFDFKSYLGKNRIETKDMAQNWDYDEG